MIVKILALIFPALLFVFKYVLPSLAEAALTDKDFQKKKVKIELIHFPVDLLFVAISYTVPQIIEIKSKLAAIEETKNDNLEQYLIIHSQLNANLNRNLILSFAMLLLVSFCVFVTKLAEKHYYAKNIKKMRAIVIPLYIIVFVLIWVSLFY